MRTPPGPAPAWQWSLGALGLAAAAFVLSTTVADPDLWGHLRFGLDIVRDRVLHAADPYAYTSGAQPWINHEWLAELLFALAWLAGGPSGLIALKAGVGALTLGLLWRHLRALGLPGVRAVIVLVPLCLPLYVPLFHYVRPQIFTFLLFTCTLLVIRRAEHGDYHWLWAAPFLAAAWINFHGGVLAGLGMLGLWAALHLPGHWHARRRILLPAAATAFALLLNPYGAELPIFLLQTATVPRPEINDWQPVPLLSLPGALYLMVLGTMVAGLVGSRRERRAVPVTLLVLAALLPFAAIRHLPLFCITALVFAGEHVADAWDRWIARAAQVDLGPPLRWAAAAPALAALGLLAAAAARGSFTRIDIGLASTPVAAVALLKDSGVSGNLMTEFSWGEYAIWHLAPRIKVGMDGRRETVYAPRVYRQYVDFASGLGDWEALLREHPADFALLWKEQPTWNLLRLRPQWQLVFEDSSSALFVRRDSPQAGPLIAEARAFVPPPPPRYFP